MLLFEKSTQRCMEVAKINVVEHNILTKSKCCEVVACLMGGVH